MAASILDRRPTRVGFGTPADVTGGGSGGERDGQVERWTFADAMRAMGIGGRRARANRGEGYTKCRWAYQANHAYSACVDLIANAVMLNGQQPTAAPWKLEPALDDDGVPLANPNPANKAPFYAFAKSCHRDLSFTAILKSYVTDGVMSNSFFGEVGYSKIISPVTGMPQPAALWLLPQAEMRTRLDEHGELREDYPFRQVRGRDRYKDFTWRQVLLFRRSGPRGDGVLPLTPVDTLSATLENAVQAERFILSQFEMGSKLGTIFKNKNWNADQALEFLEYIAANYTNTEDGHRPFAIYDDTEVIPGQRTGTDFTDHMEVQKYDARKVCSRFNADPRLISEPSQGSLGGTEREQIWYEFLTRSVNPWKMEVADQLTQQILVQGLGITDWRLSLCPFPQTNDESARLTRAQAYEVLERSGFINKRKVEDVRYVRLAVDRDIPELTDEEFEEWNEEREVPAQLQGDQPPAQITEDAGKEKDEDGKDKAPDQVEYEEDSRAGRRPRGVAEKRTDFRAAQKLMDGWSDDLANALGDPLVSIVEKGIASASKLYQEAQRKALTPESSGLGSGGSFGRDEESTASKVNGSLLLPGFGNISQEFRTRVKGQYVEAHDFAAKELERLAKAAKKSKGQRSITKASVGDIDDYLDLFGRTHFDTLYADLVKKARKVFLRGLASGWDLKRFTNELETQADKATRAQVEAIVRTASTDIFNIARQKLGDESEIVDHYIYSAILDDRTTPCCRRLDGLMISYADPGLEDIRPPNHYNCRSILTYGMTGEAFKTNRQQLAAGVSMIPSEFGGRV